MDVTIIGAGNMGRGIGSRLVAGGHTVTLIDQDPTKAQALADELGQGRSNGATVRVGTLNGIRGDVVVLAVYYPINKQLVRELGSALDNKIVVDIANPLDFTTFEPATQPGSSSAEEVASVAPSSARVVKSFNTTFAGTLVKGSVAGQPLDVFIAGDDQEAKNIVAQLARDGDLNPIDVGPLKRAQQVEGIGYLHITLQQRLNTGFQSAVKIVA